MSRTVTQHDPGWLKDRLQRHTRALFRLGWPVALSRLGIVALALADTIMVGDYSTRELAYLNLGTNSLIMVFLVVAIGLLLGTLIHTANAYGRGDFEGCGRVLRRSLTYAVLLAAGCTLISLPGETLFLLTGQTPELAREGGKVMTILAFGLVGHLVYINVAFFLEGIAKPKPVLMVMIIGNALNIGLNYILIYGKLGFPEMGAAGSAWATTALRLLMMVMVLGYIALSPEIKKFRIFQPLKQPWLSWKGQRMKGYAAGFSLGMEVMAFAALNIFAGWLGTLSLAAYGVVFNIMMVPFMLAAGIGAATSVRVGMANARTDPRDTALAGWTGYAIGSFILIMCCIPIYFFAHKLFTLYSSDLMLIAFGAPFVAYSAYVIFFDGGQAILANALRGLGETWVPTGIQTIVYVIIMIPLSYVLAFTWGRGVPGLLEAVLYASIVSVVLQGWRFRHLTANAYPLVTRKQSP